MERNLLQKIRYMFRMPVISPPGAPFPDPVRAVGENTHLLFCRSWKIIFASFFLFLLSNQIAEAQGYVSNISITSTDESCPGINDGTATISIVGGTPNFVYELQKRVGIAAYTTATFSPETPERTYTFTGLGPGSYRILIYDSQIVSVPINSDGFLVATTGTTPPAVTISGNSSVCEEQTGLVYEVPSTEGSTYLWKLPAGASIISGEGTHRIVVRFGTASGNVSVVETNSGGCKGPEASMPVEVLTKPATFAFSASGPTTFCEGEAGPELVLNGSETGVSYALFRNNLTTGIKVEGTGSAISFGNQSQKGAYQVWASLTEMGTCGRVMDGAVELNPVKNPTLTAEVQGVSCFEGSDGSINISVADGTPGYTYLWSNGATTEDVSGLTAGTYNVTVTDTNGCTVSESFTISEPVALSLSQTITPVSCEGGNTGAIDITIEGGSPEYTYVWSNGATTEDLNELTAGTYEVTVTDGKGCTLIQSFTVSDGIVLSLTANETDASCNGAATGAIELTVSGGSGNYSYSWSNGASTKDIGELTAGSYTVTVEDSDRGCSITESYTIEEPAALALTITGTDATSCGGTEGSADLSVSGGTEGYTYVWSNGATTEDLNGLSAGTYNVTVTDAKGCIATESVTIGGPTGINGLTATVKNASCFEGNDGAINLTVSGGTVPLSFVWSNGATTEDISGLTAGTYEVTVTDAGGCTASESFTITAPTTPIAALTIKGNTTACEGDRGVAYEVTARAGSTYAWSLPAGATIASGAGTARIRVNFGSESGDIKVVETNSNGCSGPEASLAVKVTKKPIEYTLSVIGSTTFCAGEPGPEFVLDGSETGVTYILYNPSSTTNVQVKRRVGTGARLSFGRANEAGVYIVFAYVTDERSCTSTMKNSFTLTPITVALSATVEQVKCKGEATGAIDLTATGGTAPYTFVWDNGATTENLEEIGAGTYTVTATDANGCTATGTYTITEPAENLSLTAELTQVKCTGEENGAIDLTVSGGTTGYTYLWSNGATTEDLENLAAGDYEVTVTDANNCSIQQSFTISAPLALSLEVTETHVSSCGGENGAIELAISGGTTGYTFAWSNGETTQDLANLSAGLYSVIVTDGNGCTLTREDIEITEPAGITALEGDVTNASCFEGTDGKIDLTVTGGTAPYTYTWEHGANTENIENLAAGTYRVTIKDANGCEISAPFMVEEPQQLTVSLSGTNVSTCGAEDGAIDLTVSGGTGEYTVEWGTGETSEDRSGLSAGAYSVVVTDASGCTATGSITISEPGGISSLSAEITNVKCVGDRTGAINVTVVGSTEAFTYSWNNGETTEDIDNLAAGTYTLTVTDANGCTATESFTINEPANALSFTETISPVTCAGDNTGAIAIVVNGGTGSYTFSWSNGQTTQNISELLAGDYELTVTDENGCSVRRTINVPEGVLLTLSATTENITCNNESGAIDLTVNGGSGNYSYSWSNEATTQDLGDLAAGIYEVTVTDLENGCTATDKFTISEQEVLALELSGTNPSSCGLADGTINMQVSGGSGEYTYSWSNGATTQNLTGLAAGTYEVSVTDANGCTVKESFVLADPAGISSLTAEVTNVNCFGAETGAIDVTVTGGTAPYTYEWNNGETGEDLLEVASGTYTIIVRDANGCMATETFTITAPVPLSLTSAISSPSCAAESTGAIDITVTGGSGNYDYSWSNGAATEDINELQAGNYEVTVTDTETGCTSVQSFTISEPAVLSFERMAPTGASSCGAADGYVEVAITGGSGEYTYLWSNGATTEDISGLAAGVYSLTVTDAAGCTLVGSVSIDEPSSFTSINAYTSDVSCFGGSDGTIGLTITGGVEPFTYQWTNGATTEGISGLPAGLYGVTVRDANGCSVSLAELPIFEPAELELTAELMEPLCQEANSGRIDLTVTEGVAPYTYLWSNGATTEDLPDLVAGTYEVVVTDANGCQQSASYTLNAPAELTLTLTLQDATSCNNSDGSISLEVTGGSGPYSYEWSNGATTKDLSGLNTGTYSVVVKDKIGCEAVATATIEAPSAISSLTATIQDVTCGTMVGAIDLQVEGGTAPFTYQWSNGATDEDLTGLAAGNYEVTVTDNAGCSATQMFVVEDNAPFTVSEKIENVTCAGEANGRIVINVADGTAPYTYNWSDGTVSSDGNVSEVSNLGAGTYSVSITDATGCSATYAYTITEPAMISLWFGTTGASVCGGSDGYVNLEVSGGTGEYTYLWSNGATTKDVTGLTAGFYSVTVTDAAGCTAYGMTDISEPSSFTSISGFVKDVSCFGSSDGAIDLQVTGGIAPFTYIWSHGATTEDVTDLPVGFYAVTVADANGCTISASDIPVFGPDAPLTLSSAVTEVSCENGNSGAIDLSVSGGKAPYLYLWSNGATSEDLSEVGVGEYSVVVTDANECSITRSYTIESQSLVSFNLKGIEHESCPGAGDGAVGITYISGGVEPYSIRWSNGEEEVQYIRNLQPGSYSVVVTDSKGCTAEASYVIEPATPISLSATTMNVNCGTENTGGIDLSVSGGTAPYEFLWSNGETTEDLVEKNGGDYTVVVTDANGCVAEETFTISAPDALVLTASTTDVVCSSDSDGSIDLSISGGSGDYTIEWSTGATSEDLNNLSAGTYSVTVRDSEGCSATASFTINIIDNLVINLPTEIVRCFPASVELDAGYNPEDGYEIEWIETGETTRTIIVDQMGFHSRSVNVKNTATGCIATAEVAVIISDEITSSVRIIKESTESCANDPLLLRADVWNEGETPTFKWFKNGMELAGEISETLNLTTYADLDSISVEVDVDLSCAIENPVTAYYIIHTPELAEPTVTASAATVCVGSENPIFTASGLIEGATYKWYRGSGATRILVAENTDTYTPNVTEAGEYTYLITQTNSRCGESSAATISFTIRNDEECDPVDPPLCENPLLVNLGEDKLACASEEVILDAGYSPEEGYEIEWSTGETSQQIVAQPGIENYSVTVKHTETGCNGSDAIKVVLREEISGITVSIDEVNSPDCYGVLGLKANIYMNGLAYDLGEVADFSWQISREGSSEDLAETSNELELNDYLEGDVISVSIHLNLECLADDQLTPVTANYTVDLPELEAPEVNRTAYAICSDEEVPVFRATGARLSWYAGSVAAENLVAVNTNLLEPSEREAGTYKYFVTQFTKRCGESEAVEISFTIKSEEECEDDNQFNCGAFSAKLLSLQEPSCDRNNGELKYEISGGEAPYFVRYSFGDELVEQSRTDAAFVLPIINIPAGKTVKVFVRDRRGLECSLENVLEMAPQVRATLTKTANGDVNCFGQATGKAKLVISGGNAPYQYYRSEAEGWVNLAGNEIEFSDLAAGIHNIMVRDNEEDDCNASAAVEILNLNPKLDFTFQTESANCNDNIGKIKINTITGGNGGPYKVKLAGDENYRDYDSGTTFEGLSRGFQTVTVTDGVCEFSKQVMVGSPGLIAVEYQIQSLSCESPALRAGLNIQINEALTEVRGPYLVAVSQMNTSGEYVVIPGMEALEMVGNQLVQYGLYNGTYAIEVRAANMEGCPENIRGIVVNEPEMPIAITFTHNPLNIYCAGAIGGVQLTELKGKPNTDFTINLYQNEELVRQKVLSRDEYAVNKGAEGVFVVSDLVEGVYRMMITQEQGGCEGLEASEPVAFEIKKKARMLAAEVTAKTESFPERGSGSLTLSVQTNSGEPPYISSIYLVEPLFPGQFYESEGDTVVYDPIEATFSLTYTDLPAGKYEIYVVDKNGCSVYMEETIAHDQRLFIPNVITPNGDGYNENFYVRNIPESGTRLIMTNRWGKVVYSTENYQNDWDGGTEPDGIYFYHLFVAGGEGMEMKGWIEIRRGAQP